MRQDSRVYFIQSCNGGPIKIGSSKDPAERMNQLQSAHPYRLVILATTDGGKEHEHKLHRRFASGRLMGEWFSESPDLLAAISGFATCPDSVYVYESHPRIETGVENVGVRLAEARRALGLSITDVAAHLHVAVSTYSRIEAGLASVTADRLVDLARYYRVPVAQLLRPVVAADTGGAA